MKTLKVIGMVPLILVAATAFSQGDNRAVPRGGGGGGGGGSSAGSRHTGGGGSPSQGAPNSGGSSASGGGRAYSQPGAAGRRPRPGTGTGTRDYYGNEYGHYGRYGNYGYYGYYGYPYSYYYSPYAYWGYPGYYGYGLGFGYGYPYGGYGYAPAPYYGGSYGPPEGAVAQVRTLVDPPKALVYVDGRYVGMADAFDGLLQRLTISPGRHDITFKLEGYTSHTYSVYAAPEETLKLRLDMVRGTGETKETVGDYERWAENDRQADREREMAREAERERESARNREADSNPSAAPSISMPGGDRGEVLLEIEPPDASVYVDGEFRGKASQLTRLELSLGRHRVEVVRPGYRTTETVISVEGEARKLVLKLER